MTFNKPSHAEDEFFAREEIEKKRKLALSQAKALAQTEKERLATLHHMHCPKCGLILQQLTYQGMALAKCFHCHGVFLDERDLEKAIGQEGYLTRLLQAFAHRSGAQSDE